MSSNPVYDSEDVDANMNSAEKMRIRMAAEGYNTLNNPSEKQPTDDKQPLTEPEDNRRKKGKEKCTLGEKQLAVILVISFIISVLLAVLLVFQHFYYMQSSDICDRPECVEVSGSMLKYMDLTADPCVDFYQYSCGKYADNPLIPPDKTKWSAFSEVRNINVALINKMLKLPGSEYMGVNSTAIAKVKTLYNACMNISAREEIGTGPLLGIISSLGSWPVAGGNWSVTNWNLNTVLAESHLYGVEPLFGMGVERDMKNSSLNIISMDQAGLTFSDYTKYIGNDTDKYKNAFTTFFSAITGLLGGTNTAQMATDVWNFEVEIAKIQDKPEERQDISKLYNKLTVEQLQGMMGNTINLGAYFKLMFGEDVPQSEHIVVYAPKFLVSMSKTVNSTSKETLANYIVWHVVQSLVGYMPMPFRQAYLQLKGVLYGTSAEGAQWNTCVERADSSLGFAVGALFTQDHFAEKDKNNAENIVTMIREQFIANIPDLDWMDEETQKKAIDKAENVEDQIGYPEYIKDPVKLDEHYEKLIIEDDAFANALHVIDFAVKKTLDKRGKPPDNTEWGMTPAQVNAYYEGSRNQMVFPAGILQHPFYNPVRPMSMNFGSIGMVMGHELTHGFDSSGRQMDKYGNLHNWWGNESAKNFKEKSQCLIDQYNQYKVGDGHVNGITTLGENIADNGGIKTSYHAFQKWSEDNSAQQVLPGFNMTHDQLFFLGFSQMWCAYYTPEYAQASLVTDVHTYAKYRVVGVLSNTPEFSQAFKCKPEEPMNPVNKCSVW